MRLSHNVLIIESLSTQPEQSEMMMRFKSEIKSEIKFYCPVTGNHFRTTVITAESKGYSQEEDLKNVIHAFLNGDVYTENRYYNRPIECLADIEHIHHVDIQVQEPFKSLFEQLFDVASWKYLKKC